MMRGKELQGLIAILLCACGPLEQKNKVETARSHVSPGAEGQEGFIKLGANILKVRYELKEGFAVVGGDMLLNPQMVLSSSAKDELGLAGDNKFRGLEKSLYWLGRRIPFELPDRFPYAKEFNAAVNEWKTAGILWEPKRSTDIDFVKIVLDPPGMDENVCAHATLGKQKGLKILALRSPARQLNGCNVKSNLLHEMAHSAGFIHEFQRSDRDNFVHVPRKYANMPNFAIFKFSDNRSTFDVNSITMYGSPFLFHRNGSAIPWPKKLSPQDVAATNALYAPSLSRAGTQNLALSIYKSGSAQVSFKDFDSVIGCSDMRLSSSSNSAIVSEAGVSIIPIPSNGHPDFKNFRSLGSCEVRFTIPEGTVGSSEVTVALSDGVSEGSLTFAVSAVAEPPYNLDCEVFDAEGKQVLRRGSSLSQCRNEICPSYEVGTPGGVCRWGDEFRREFTVRCSVENANGNILSSRQTTPSDCRSQCPNEIVSHAGGKCSIGDKVIMIMAAPASGQAQVPVTVDTCKLIDESGKISFEKTLQAVDCDSACRPSSDFPVSQSFKCTWGKALYRDFIRKSCGLNVNIIRKDATGTPVRGSDGMLVYDTTRLPGSGAYIDKTDCEARCASFTRFPERTCTWDGINVKK